NGVSPLPPLFFANLASVLWAASNVWRAAMLETIYGSSQATGKAAQTLQTSYLGMDSVSLADLSQRQARIRSLISRESLRLPFAWAVLAVMMAFFLTGATRLNVHNLGSFYLPRPQSLFYTSLEGFRFDCVFAFLLLTSYVGLSFNLLRIYALWSEFRALLRR